LVATGAASVESVSVELLNKLEKKKLGKKLRSVGIIKRCFMADQASLDLLYSSLLEL
jgi:hypothetical protein